MRTLLVSDLVLVSKRHHVTSGQRCNWAIVLSKGRNLVLNTRQNKVVADVVEHETVIRQLAHAQLKSDLDTMTNIPLRACPSGECPHPPFV